MKRLIAALFALPLLASAAFAQAIVQAAPTHLDATTTIGFTANAVNVGGASGALTITVPAGLYAYITGFSFSAAQDGTGGTAQNNSTFTSTGISGSPSWSFSIATTASTGFTWDEMLPIPLKSSSPGTNVVITPPAANLHAAFNIKVHYFLAP